MRVSLADAHARLHELCSAGRSFPSAAGACGLADLPEVAQAALELVPPWMPGSACKAAHLYTDGSEVAAAGPPTRPPGGARASSAAWAVVIVVEGADSALRIFDVFGGSLADALSPCVGDGAQDCLHAEGAAMLWALAWVTRASALPAFEGASFTLNFDNTAVGQAASGSAKLEADAALHAQLFGMGALATAMADVAWCHVKSHAGHPWNELADAAARAIARGELLPHGCEAGPLARFLACRQALDWAWFIPASADPRSGLPPAEHGSVVAEPPVNCISSDVWYAQKTGPARPPAVLRFRIASVNVLTLGESTGKHGCAAAGAPAIGRGLVMPGRTELIEEELHKAGLHIVAMQETRGRDHGVRVGAKYFALRAPGKRGKLGCELWFARGLPFAWRGTTPLYIRPADLAVRSFTERMLVVCVRAEWLRVDIIACHAPCEPVRWGTEGDAARCAQQEWWAALDDAASALPTPREPLILLGDFNARLGSAVSECVGPHCAERQNSNGELLHKFLVEHELFLPATFGTYQRGPSTTWSSTAGGEWRIDHIALPADWAPGVVAAWVERDAELGHRRDDHWPVCAEVRLAAGRGRTTCKHRAAVFDRADAAAPGAKPELAAIAGMLTQPAWGTSVHDHCADLFGQLRGLLAGAFPKKKKAARPARISERTWAWVELRRHLRSAARAARRRGLALLEKGDGAASLLQHELHMQLRAMISQVGAVVQAEARRDRNAALESLAADAALAETERDYATLWRQMRCLTGIGRKARPALRPLPLLKRPDGIPVADATERASLWQEEFAEHEAGEAQDREAFAMGCVDRRNAWPSCDDPVSPDDIVSLREFSVALLTGPRGRAHGEDGVCQDVYLAAPNEFARALYPLVFKSTALATEPIQHKGGMLQEIHKARSTTFFTDAYRGIMLGDAVGKRIHAAVRFKLAGVAENAFRPTMFGSGKGLGTDMCALMVREFLASSRRRKLSAAAIFVDFRRAYHRLVREFIVGGECNAERLAVIVKRLDLPESAAEELVGLLDSVSLLRRAGASEHMERVVREMHESTWFTVQDGIEVVATLCGSRPGDPFGDFIFAFLMAAQLGRATERMRAERLLCGTPWDGARSISLPDGAGPLHEVELSEASYADDVTMLLTDRCPRALVEKAAATTGLLADTFLAHACLINPEPGKTEVVLCLQGRGTQAVRQEVFLERGGKLSCDGGHAGQLRVTVSFQYKHMGGIVDATGSMRYELKARADSAAAAARPLRKRVIENSALTRNARTMLGRALVASRLHTNAQAWMPLDMDSRARHQVATLAMYRRITGLGGDAEVHFNDAAVLAEGPFAEPQEAVTIARLRFLTRLLARAPNALFALLRSGRPGHGSWLGALADDLAWLHRHLGGDSPCPGDDPALRAEQAAAMAVAAPKRWLALVRQAASSAQRRRRNRQEAANGLLACDAILQGDAVLGDAAAPPSAASAAPRPRRPAPALPMLPCPECGHLFEGLRALGPHRYRVHGVRRLVRDYVDGTVCGACLMEFHSRRRLIHHLQFSGTHCLLRLSAARDPLPAEITNALDAAEAARYKEVRKRGGLDRLQRLPAVRMPGPQLPPAAGHPVGAVVPENLADDPDADLPNDEPLPPGGPRANLASDPDDVLPDDEPLRPGSPRQLDEPARDDESGCEQRPPGELERIRTLSYPVAVVLHLCSGRRRAGDVEHHLGHAARRVPDLDVLVLSIDVAIDPKRGNLASMGTVRFWAGQAAARRVIGIIGGPPCETWSGVRGKGVPGLPDDRVPPVLRTAAEPWGIEGLRLKHWEQLRIATVLLQAFLILFSVLLRAGGFALIEHPAQPREPGKASIWRLPLVCKLAEHPCVFRHDFCQGPLGQVSLKPTSLLLLRLPSLPLRLRERAAPGYIAPAPRMGKQEDGSWATAPLKEYPSGMCAAIADAIVDTLIQRAPPAVGSADDANIIESFRDLALPWDPYLADGDLGMHDDFDADAAEALPFAPLRWSDALPTDALHAL